MLYRLIHAETANYPIVLSCRVLHVARSSCHAWREGEAARPARRAADDVLAHAITVLHIASRRTYGVPRIHAELRRLGHRVNRKRIAHVMRERGIRGVTRRKHRSLTRPDVKAKPAPDLIGRDLEIGTRTWSDRATARAEVFTFIETFYNRRLGKHKIFGYLSPAETRQRHQHTLAA